MKRRYNYNKITDLLLIESKRNSSEIKEILDDNEKNIITNLTKVVGYETPFILSTELAKNIDCYKLSLTYFFKYTQSSSVLEFYGKIFRSYNSELRKMGLVVGEYEVWPKNARKHIMLHALFQDTTLSNEEADKRTKAICLETIPWVKEAEKFTNKRNEKQMYKEGLLVLDKELDGF